MFSPFKKKSTAGQALEKTSSASPQPDIDQEGVDALIAQHRLYGRSFAQFITAKAVHGDVLDISIKVAKDADQAQLEALYERLGRQLQTLGIGELNLNVILSDDVPAVSSGATAVQMHRPTTASHPPQDSTSSDTIAKPASKQSELAPHPRIHHIIAVASGKGGVGKSTTTVNIALALQKLGKRVGILDADIYGPSVPDMLGVAGVRPTIEYEQFVPINAHGIAMLSIGSLIDAGNTPVAWRGIKATGALMQLYTQTNWPRLDYLIIDMPPGTGDIALTLAQKIPITGAVIVTTPQHIALLDAQKGMEMFFKTDIAVLGVVENMALHTCSSCGHTEAIFGSEGGSALAKSYQVPLLGQLPLAAAIRKQMDVGRPSVLVDDAYAAYYLDIAKAIDTRITGFDKGGGQRIF